MQNERAIGALAGAIAWAVKVGLVSGELLVNPSPQQAALSELSLTYAGASGGRALMVEAAGDQADVLDGLRLQGLLPDLTASGGQGASAPREMYSEADALRALDALQSRALRAGLLSGARRPDGRRAGELRRVSAAAGVLPRVVHGSALFDRGETQCLAAATVAPEREAVAADAAAAAAAAAAVSLSAPLPSAATASANAATATLASVATPSAPATAQAGGAAAAGAAAGQEVRAAKRLLLHYSFPPYSTGEVGKAGGPGRREIGHGALAEKALAPLMPGLDAFPFWARISAETLGSSGSSSMAAVCGGALALRAAGVPLAELGAGVSVGLAVERPPQLELLEAPGSAPPAVYSPGGGARVDYGRSVLLTDIQGMEDHLGDMDFKVGVWGLGFRA
ncbi:polyribonucleotidenucleotidyltransferase [Monoraphidium neglectum]|uniref:Polyribonucleotidenucleotidyltransferase n=1 Tax=Monoraphidium neglectum TaxID=145388 RepID=A0A0D2IUW0_9CHLO|nr:polyribonucleotidenucleotidyltransferase [Monoraphidium neglectum]KIY91717.1 polyribonucleotidenucleotidyltransferase [Monoraphidium neglectum]|eukprot:XP_013890737.1 polyribonucleotidenucleotidyltransferase [Monoraphidium neglectum]